MLVGVGNTYEKCRLFNIFLASFIGKEVILIVGLEPLRRLSNEWRQFQKPAQLLQFLKAQ